MEDTNILVVGAGPVGLMVAHVISNFGEEVTIIDRSPYPTRHPKMDITNARSMELFRKFGLEECLRAVAIPETNNFDVSWITDLTGHELHRFSYDCPIDYRKKILEINDGTQPQVPPMRVSQVEIEPVLRKVASDNPLVSERFGIALEDFQTADDSIIAILNNTANDETELIRCNFLIGCDGGNSRVRDKLGITLGGPRAGGKRFSIHFQSDDRNVLQNFGIAWHYQSWMGSLVAQNDIDSWTLHTKNDPDEKGIISTPEDLLIKFAGCDFNYDIRLANHWTPHLVVADVYSDGNVFLVGDAAHQYNPTGGYGMNTGIGDAVDIGWKVAALAKGIGGPKLISSYNTERRPVGLRNRDWSGRHAKVREKISKIYDEEFAGEMSGNQKCRERAGRRIAQLGNAENDSYGIEYGYAYPDSPIIFGETDAEISIDPFIYTPTTSPGARLPSVHLKDCSALYDKLGLWFSLISFNGPPGKNWVTAADSIDVQIKLITLEEPELESVFAADLILVRPDHHVVWRGKNLQRSLNPHEILRQALGW